MDNFFDSAWAISLIPIVLTLLALVLTAIKDISTTKGKRERVIIFITLVCTFLSSAWALTSNKKVNDEYVKYKRVEGNYNAEKNRHKEKFIRLISNNNISTTELDHWYKNIKIDNTFSQTINMLERSKIVKQKEFETIVLNILSDIKSNAVNGGDISSLKTLLNTNKDALASLNTNVGNNKSVLDSLNIEVNKIPKDNDLNLHFENTKDLINNVVTKTAFINKTNELAQKNDVKKYQLLDQSYRKCLSDEDWNILTDEKEICYKKVFID